MNKTLIIFALLSSLLIKSSLSLAGVATEKRTILSNRGNYIYPISDLEILDNTSEFKSAKQQRKIDYLKDVKFNIINGNVLRAKLMLREARITSEETKPIQLRYLSMIHFIEGEYSEALDILKRPEMQSYNAKKHTCLMKSFLEVITNQDIDIIDIQK